MELPALDAGNVTQAERSSPNRDQKLKLTKEGVGETSGETAGRPTQQGSPFCRYPAEGLQVLRSLRILFPLFRRKRCSVGISTLTCSPTPSFF